MKVKMKLIIGLIGRMGSGKGFVGDYLCENYNASRHTISDILADILNRLHLTVTREHLQKLGASLRSGLGYDVIINALKGDIEKDNSNIIIIDGIRYMNEVEMLRTFENNLLLSIDAKPELRYDRCVLRGEKGEARITFEEFLGNENSETEQHISEVMKEADYTINNDGTKEELIEKIEKILKEKV